MTASAERTEGHTAQGLDGQDELTDNLAQLAVVVLAAGKGTRMRSRLPKVLHQVGGEPMLFHVLRQVAALGVPPERTVIVIGYGAAQVREALAGRGAYLFAEQTEQLGTAHAVQQADSVLPASAEHVLVLYGDGPLVRAASLRGLAVKHFEMRPLVTLVTATTPDPTGYGRIFRDPNSGVFHSIVEESDLSPAQSDIKEFNAGIYIYRAQWLWPALRRVIPSRKGEYYLTDLAQFAAQTAAPPFDEDGDNHNSSHDTAIPFPVETIWMDADDIRGINDRAQLAEVDGILRRRLVLQHQLNGVTINDPATVYISAETKIGPDSQIEPNTHLRGHCRIGANCVIGPNTVLENAIVGDDCQIIASFVENSTLENRVRVGPMAHIRLGCYLEHDVQLGNFAEANRSHLGPTSRQHHFSYLGDATLGEDVNIGAGTITANYDGKSKHKTTIGAHAFIGSDTILRAPVEIGAGAATGAGSVVTHDVPAYTTVAGVPARPISQ